MSAKLADPWNNAAVHRSPSNNLLRDWSSRASRWNSVKFRFWDLRSCFEPLRRSFWIDARLPCTLDYHKTARNSRSGSMTIGSWPRCVTCSWKWRRKRQLRIRLVLVWYQRGEKGGRKPSLDTTWKVKGAVSMHARVTIDPPVVCVACNHNMTLTSWI